MKKKTIFFLTSRYPYPLEKGDKLRAYHQIKELSKTHNIILCSITDKTIHKEWKNELSKYCLKQFVFKLNLFVLGFNLLKAFFSTKPYQVHYFYQRRIQKEINTILEENQIDIVYCQLIRVTEYIKDVHYIPKTIDYMDALSEGMYKRSMIANGLKKIIFKIESKRLKKYENVIFDYFDNHTIISNQDKNLISHPNHKDITVVPNGVDESFLAYDTMLIEKEYDIVFIGNLSYAPNIEACQYIVNKILPVFESNNVSIKILLSGVNPSPKILKLGKNPKVTISGWVDDIKEVYCKGKVFVAPLFIGTGLQNKLLEAMSLKVPCVTTQLTNNALKADNNKHLYEANTPEEFFNKIQLLLTNKVVKQTMVFDAHKFISNNYNWIHVTKLIPLEK